MSPVRKRSDTNTCTFLATYRQVCLPGLHISLGIFYRLFSLLEDVCHQLDFKLAQNTSPSHSSQTSFTEYSLALDQTTELQDERQNLDEAAETLEQVASYLTLNLPSPLTSPVIRDLSSGAASKRDRIS